MQRGSGGHDLLGLETLSTHCPTTPPSPSLPCLIFRRQIDYLTGTWDTVYRRFEGFIIPPRADD